MKISNLLTTANPKTLKGVSRGYLTSVLHLAPARLSGYNMCPAATPGCAASCLFTAGRAGIMRKGETTNVIQTARIRKTIWFMENREAFLTQLAKEITATIAKAEKLSLIPVFRLNATSDVRWENIPVTVKGITYSNFMTAFPTIQFYDYTKIENRRNIPANYHLTFSLAESNHKRAEVALFNGMNVAAVFKTLPATFMNRAVVNGDETDLRFLDIPGVIVGLKAKGKAKKDTTGFVQITN